MNKDKELIKRTDPKIDYAGSFFRAFFVGGTICMVAQIILELLKLTDLDKETISSLTSISMIFIGSLLTALGYYDKIGQFAGCGTIVPITGYANSMTSCAIEYKTEGLLTGTIANMFKLAGSVIVTAVLTGVIFGSIGYLVGII